MEIYGVFVAMSETIGNMAHVIGHCVSAVVWYQFR